MQRFAACGAGLSACRRHRAPRMAAHELYAALASSCVHDDAHAMQRGQGARHLAVCIFFLVPSCPSVCNFFSCSLREPLHLSHCVSPSRLRLFFAHAWGLLGCNTFPLAASTGTDSSPAPSMNMQAAKEAIAPRLWDAYVNKKSDCVPCAV